MKTQQPTLHKELAISSKDVQPNDFYTDQWQGLKDFM